MNLQRVTIEIDGNLVQGFALKSPDGLWVHVQNRTFLVPAPKKFRRGTTSSAHGQAGEITAPMPGKVIKISVDDGASVKAGQTILVLEAMKMEYALKAPVDGKVSLKNHKPGDQVKLGEVVAEVAEK